MADEQKKVVILEVQTDLTRLLTEATAARKAIDDLKNKQKELEEQGKRNTVEYEANAAALRKASEALKASIKSIDEAGKEQQRLAEQTKKATVETEKQAAATLVAESQITQAITKEGTEQEKLAQQKAKTAAETEAAAAKALAAESSITQAIQREQQEAVKLATLKTKEALEGERLVAQKVKEEQETERLAQLKAKTAADAERFAATAQLSATKQEQADLRLAATQEQIEERRQRALQRSQSSYVQLSKQLEENRRIIRDLLASETELTKEDEDLIKSTQQLDQRLKSIDATVGVHTRNVGDYTGAIGTALSSLNLMPGALGNAATGVQSLSAAFKILLANPIVLIITAIIAALTALYKAFTSTDEGATEVEAILKAIGNVLNVVTQRLAVFAQGLIDVFSGNFSEGAKKMGDAFTGIADQMRNAATAGYEYIKALDAIEDANDNFISQTAKNRNEIAKLQALAADQTQPLKVREAALAKSLEIGEQELKFQQSQAQKTYQEELKNQADLLGIKVSKLQEFIEADNDTAEKLLANDKQLAAARNQLNNEGQVNLEELFKKSLDTETEFFETNKRNISKLSGFRKEAADAATQQEEKRAKAQADAQLQILINNKTVIELRLLQEKEYSKEYLEDKVKLFEAERNIELANTKLTDNQKLLINQQTFDKIGVFTRQFNQDRIDDAKKALDAQFASLENVTELEQAQYATRALNQQAFLAEQVTNGTISQQEYVDQLAEINFNAAQNDLQLKLDEINDKLLYVKIGSDEEIRLLKEQADLKNQINTAVANKAIENNNKVAKSQEQLLQDEINGYKTFGATLKSLFKENTAAYKAFATVEIVADTAQAAIAAYKSVVGIPIVGPALAPIAAGAAIAYGALQLGKVQGIEFKRGGIFKPRDNTTYVNTIYPKAARGMVLGGQPHSRGGTKFHGSDGSQFEAEAEELLVIVNKNSTDMLKTLSGINVAGGGVNFYQGGGVFSGHLQDGGFAARAASATVLNSNNAVQETKEVIGNVKFVVAVQDINEAQDGLATVEDRANIG